MITKTANDDARAAGTGNSARADAAAVRPGRRRFLIAAVAAVSGIGGVASAVPFVSSWAPSARARAIGAPVEVDIARIEPGAMITVKWQGKPVWVVRRTEESLERMRSIEGVLRDPASSALQQPAYAVNEHRSINPEYAVLVGICTHLGCSPNYRPELAPADLGPEWKGGFFCPCHGSRFDLAGRVYAGVPAPLNLEVPPHEYLSDSRIRIGTDTASS